MRVSLAAQVLSASTADALEYLDKVMELKQFAGCSATVEFIRLFNRLFDILNSRNPITKGSKSALRLTNKEDWQPFFAEAYDYILGLTDLEDKKMVNSRRKTGFVGFLVAMTSIRSLFNDLVETG